MNEPPQMLSSWIQVDIPPNSEKRKEEGLLKQFFLVTCAPVLQFSCEVAPGVRGPTAVGVRGVEAEADGRDRGMGQPQGQQVRQLNLIGFAYLPLSLSFSLFFALFRSQILAAFEGAGPGAHLCSGRRRRRRRRRRRGSVSDNAFSGHLCSLSPILARRCCL